VKLRDHNCGFKAGRREIYLRVPLYGELHRYIPAMAHGLGYEVAEMEVHHRPREHGRSKFGLERYLRGLLDLFTVLVITRYGRRPGHFFGGIGVVAGVIGFAILLYLSGVWVFTDHPIGNRPLLTFGVLLEVVAVQLLAVGILAELILHRTAPRPTSQDLVIADLAEPRAS
jgi:dolichol-phosphate mannosyltransferase